MIRFILSILLFFSLQGSGQIINASRPYRALTVSLSSHTYSYLFDDYPSPFIGFSFFKLKSSYSGSCVRVRRSSDNAEQDIGFSGNYFDSSSLKTFVGSNSAYVVTAYDQTGNEYNLTQSTASRQPRIINAGVIDRNNGWISMFTIAANGTGLGLSFTPVSTTAHSLFIVFTPNGGDFFSRVVSFRSDVSDYSVYCPAISNAVTLTTFGSYASSSFQAGVTVSSSDLNLYAAIHTGSSIINSNKNGAEQTYSHTLSSNIRQYTYGCSALADGSFDDGNVSGYITEVVSWNGNKYSDKAGILNNINGRYSIY